MAAHTLRYPLGEGDSIEAVQTALISKFRCAAEPEALRRATLYDSFDWRLHRAGLQLDEVKGEGLHNLVLRALDSATPFETVRLGSEPPRFAREFPPGLMRERIAPPLAMRTLLPQVEVRTRVRLLKLFDREEKTVLRIALEESQARHPGRGEYQPMGGQVQLLPVRGYGKYLTRVERFLEQKLKLVSRQEPIIDLALRALGRQPRDYSSRLNFKLDPKQPAGEVVRRIQLQLLETLEANLPGTRADLDSEFLHDLRVAVRRTRSALTQIKGVFPDAVVEEFKTRFAWVGQITSPTRDMDVYLLGFDAYRESLPEEYQPYMEPLKQFLQAHQQQEQQAMVRKINSPHFHTLLKEWRAFLETPPDPENDGEAAAKPIRKVAARRIHKIFRRVLEEGLAIDAYSPPEALHELRKNCKKLRYLLEFFQSLYPPLEVRPLIKALKSLLDNLGDFQDLEVQAEKLRQFAHQMVQEGEVPADTLLAMGMLVDNLLKRQQQARETFDSRFAHFSRPEHVQTYESLFGKGTANQESLE